MINQAIDLELFIPGERILIEQGLKLDALDQSDPALMLRARVRNLAEKYRELAKRERLRSELDQRNAERARALAAVMEKIGPPS